MPRRTFTPEFATVWRCSAKRCLFTDQDRDVVSQHEYDAHGPGWIAAEHIPPQRTAQGSEPR